MSWPGAIAAFLALAGSGLTSPDPARVQGASVAAAALVVLPAATALATVEPRGSTRDGHPCGERPRSFPAGMRTCPSGACAAVVDCRA